MRIKNVDLLTRTFFFKYKFFTKILIKYKKKTYDTILCMNIILTSLLLYSLQNKSVTANMYLSIISKTSVTNFIGRVSVPLHNLYL